MRFLVSACVTAVPERTDMAERVAAMMDAPVFYDRAHLGAPAGIMGALMTAANKPLRPTHLLIVEDDAILCRDFGPKMMDRIVEKPREAISYCWLGPADEPRPTGPFIQRDGWWGTQAWSVPYSLGVDLIQWFGTPNRRDDVIARSGCAPEHADAWGNAGDAWLRFALEDNEYRMWHCVPSLVQHGEPETSFVRQPSEMMIAHRRRTPWFVDDD